jgi:phage replication initiation protein
LAIETVQAEVSRVVRWAMQTAAPTLSLLVKLADEATLFEVCEHKGLPGRLQKFSDAELKNAFSSAFQKAEGAHHANA